MDKETARYIRIYFSRLMTEIEHLALNNLVFSQKTQDNPLMRKPVEERGWICDKLDVHELLKDGNDEFELNLARRIMRESPEKIYLNNCPKCNTLAGTPFARQCRNCGHDWHDLTVARFKLSDAFQPASRPFFLLGHVTNGRIKQGQFIDLTFLGLNNRARIETMEFAFKKTDGTVWQGIALRTNELTAEEKTVILKASTFGRVIDILKEI